MSRRRSALAIVGALVLAASACDSGPAGPSAVAGSVVGNADLGAAVLDVTWRGVQSFEARGSTRVFWAPVAGFEDRYRVVLVSPEAGDLPFEIHVDDIYLEAPSVAVVDAAGSDDVLVSVSELRVRLER